MKKWAWAIDFSQESKKYELLGHSSKRWFGLWLKYLIGLRFGVLVIQEHIREALGLGFQPSRFQPSRFQLSTFRKLHSYSHGSQVRSFFFLSCFFHSCNLYFYDYCNKQRIWSSNLNVYGSVNLLCPRSILLESGS